MPLLFATKFDATSTVFEHKGVVVLSQCHSQRCVVSLCARLLCIVMCFHGLSCFTTAGCDIIGLIFKNGFGFWGNLLYICAVGFCS